MSYLRRLQIIQPCTKPLSATEDRRFLHCDHCPYKVIDLSACSREQAEGILQTQIESAGSAKSSKRSETGRICCLTRRNHFGELLLADGPVRTVRSRLRRAVSRCRIYAKTWASAEVEAHGSAPRRGSRLLQSWLLFPAALFAYIPGSEVQGEDLVTYGDVRINSSVHTVLTFLEGTAGALAMVGCCLVGLLGLCSLAFIKRRRSLVVLLIWLAFLLAFALAVGRSFSATFFNEVDISAQPS